jgi:hypothetical protein
VHFLNGYEGGRYVRHAVGTAVEIGAGYDPARSKETLGSDWALIKLNRELGAGDRVLETLREPPPVGAGVVLGGYQRDSPLVIVADTDCRILGRAVDANGRALVPAKLRWASGAERRRAAADGDGRHMARRRSCGCRGARHRRWPCRASRPGSCSGDPRDRSPVTRCSNCRV